MSINIDMTLTQIEKEDWGEPDYPSHLVTTCHQLRKKQLKDFTIEDLRIMIGQNISLPYLIPLAIKKLKENVLAEGDFYPGDLLKSVLESDRSFWKNNKVDWQQVIDLYSNSKGLFNDKKQIQKSFANFEQIH